MCDRTCYIKIFDEQFATALERGGFSYIKQKINGDQSVYAFEKTPALVDVITNLKQQGHYQEIVCIEDDALSF